MDDDYGYKSGTPGGSAITSSRLHIWKQNWTLAADRVSGLQTWFVRVSRSGYLVYSPRQNRKMAIPLTHQPGISYVFIVGT